MVFAVRPELHAIGNVWLDPTPDSDDPYSAAWFLELLPDLTSKRPIPHIWVKQPKQRSDRGRQVFCTIVFDPSNSMTHGLTIDQDGREVPHPRVSSDDYKNLSSVDRVRLNLPHPGDIRFVPFDESKYARPATTRPSTAESDNP